MRGLSSTMAMALLSALHIRRAASYGGEAFTRQRDVKVEPLEKGLKRSDFPSRQTYRAYLRAIEKQEASK